jgi:NAD(P)-dependent dehydrogenase (short-subunit alcohol dehydrogenase family)
LLNCNWKTPAENFVGDAYHVGWTHAASLSVLGGELTAMSGNKMVPPDGAGTQVTTRFGHGLGILTNAGFYPDGGGVIYTASKHALVGVVKQLAYELAPKVRVNGVAPGGMKTELGGLKATGTEGTKLNQLDNLEDLVKHITPLHVMPSPSDYCGAYVLLASRANSSATTGAFINTDGGIGMRGFMTTAGGDDL